MTCSEEEAGQGLVGALKAEFFNLIIFLCCVNFLGLQKVSTTSLRAAVSPPTLVRSGCRSQRFSLVKLNSAIKNLLALQKRTKLGGCFHHEVLQHPVLPTGKQTLRRKNEAMLS